MVLFLLSTILALVLRYWGKRLLVNLYIYHLELCDSEKCLGVGGVNRVTFALAVFFLLHALLLRFVPKCSKLDRQSWLSKLLLFGTLIVLAWVLPNSFYAAWMHIARFAAAIFLFIQLIIFIDFAYSWNEAWLARDQQKGIVAVSALLYAASFTAFVLLLVYFGHCDSSSCKLEQFFIGFTFALTFLMSCLSLSNFVVDDGRAASPDDQPRGGLLPAGVLTLYAYWLLFTALLSDPSECNAVSSRSREFVPMVVGLLLTALSVTWASWSVASNASALDGQGQPALGEREHGIGDTDDKEERLVDEEAAPRRLRSDAAEADEDDDESDPADSPANLENAALSSRFHLLLAFASCFVCMNLSAWGSQAAAEDGDASAGLSTTNMWIKIVTQWVCILIFVWTLVAPRICPGRF